MGYRSSHPLFQELHNQVNQLLLKQAIEEVHHPSPGFYSRLFLAPKKTGDWRPVIDLSHLNQYLHSPHFKMATAHSIINALDSGLWCTSIDFKDAFLHVPIYPPHRRYLRFKVGSSLYQFKSLPFGLTTAPYVFTRVAKAVAAFVHSRGVRLLQYIDDWCIPARSAAVAHEHTTWVLDVSNHLGLVSHPEKSDLIPSQHFQYVGIEFNLALGRALPAQHRVTSWLDLASSFQAQQAPTAFLWQQVLGHLTSLEKLVPLGRLHMRPLQFNLKERWQQSTQPQTTRVQISPEARQALAWWTDKTNLLTGTPLRRDPPSTHLFTDASNVGWGAHLDDLQAEGTWTSSQKTWHINNLELLAVHLALIQFQDHIRGKAVMAMTDNTTVVGQITNQGGTLSRELYYLTRELLLWCKQHSISLTARHIPGRLNVRADMLSRRHQRNQTEWSLAQTIAERLWKTWGRPHVDLFATAQNAKLPTYVSPLPDKQAWKQDALSFQWDGIWGYAFPPFPLVQAALQKVQNSRCEVILIAPLWPAQPWFPELLDLLTEPPIQLPQTYRLLRHPDTGTFHDNLQMLNLHAWRLSSHPSAPRVSPKLLHTESQQPTEQAPNPSTTADGRSSATGAASSSMIHSRPLPR